MKRLMAALACLLLLASCGAPMSAPSASAPATPTPPASAPAAPTPPVADFASLPGDLGESFLPLPILTPSDESGRRMVYSTNMQLQTSEFMEGWRLLLNTAAEQGGFHTTAILNGHDIRNERQGMRSAFFVFRIPTENLSEFILTVERNNFNIWHLNQSAVDETQRFERTDNWLEDLLEEEQALLDLLEIFMEDEEAFADEIITLTAHLSDVRRMINELSVSQAVLMDDVIYSTVAIELFEVIESRPITTGERFQNAFTVGINVMIMMLSGILVAVLSVSPIVLSVVLIAMLIRYILRYIKRTRKQIKENRDNGHGSDM